MKGISSLYHCVLRPLASFVFLFLLAVPILAGCSANEGTTLKKEEIALKEEYQKAIDNEQTVELITNYYITWGDALKEAKENNNIFAFCNYVEGLDNLCSEIGSHLPTVEYMSNQSLIALNYDILNFHQLPLIVSYAKAYEDLLSSYGGSLGYEGLQQIAIKLNLLSENEIGFETINSLNEIIISAFSEKYDQITELYFESK